MAHRCSPSWDWPDPWDMGTLSALSTLLHPPCCHLHALMVPTDRSEGLIPDSPILGQPYASLRGHSRVRLSACIARHIAIYLPFGGRHVFTGMFFRPFLSQRIWGMEKDFVKPRETWFLPYGAKIAFGKVFLRRPLVIIWCILTRTETATWGSRHPPGQPPSRAWRNLQGCLRFYKRAGTGGRWGNRGGRCSCFSGRVMFENMELRKKDGNWKGRDE